jgi:hypothetical protein
VSLETIETLLTQSERIEGSGWSFTSLRNHDRADDFDDAVDDAYVIEVPEESGVSVPGSLGETAQGELGGGAGVVVTISPEVAESYPSIRLLLPGDPLFDVLISEATPDKVESIELICGSVSGSGSEVTQERRIEDAMQARVVQPAVENDEERKLLGGGDSIPQSENAEQTVLEWLSGFPAE